MKPPKFADAHFACSPADCKLNVERNARQNSSTLHVVVCTALIASGISACAPVFSSDRYQTTDPGRSSRAIQDGERSSAAIDKDKTLQRVMTIITEHLGAKPGSIKPDEDCQRDLGVDSLDSVEILMALEEEFNIEIAESDFEHLKTPRQTADFIKRLATLQKNRVP